MPVKTHRSATERKNTKVVKKTTHDNKKWNTGENRALKRGLCIVTKVYVMGE